jgi:hypothetical protein
VAQAAKVAGAGRRTYYDCRVVDQAFAQAWDDAVADACDVLESGVDELAKGDDMNIQLKARLALLRARRPETFGDRKRDDVDGDSRTSPHVAIQF